MMGIVLYTLVIFVLFIGIIIRPAVGIAPLLCMYALEQWAGAMHPFFNYHSSFTNILVGALILVAVGINLLKGKKIFSGYTQIFYLILILYSYAFISILWSPGIESGIEKWKTVGPYIITVLFLAPLLITEKKDLYIGLLSVIVLGAVVTILIFKYAQWDGRFIVLAGVSQFRGGNPLAIGQMAGYVILAMTFITFKSKWLVNNFVRFIIIALCFVLAVKTGSRGQIVIVLLLSLALLPMKFPAQISKSVKMASIVTGAMLIIVIAAWSLQNYSLENRWSKEDLLEQGGGRLAMARKLINTWLDSPESIIIGLGNSASFSEKIIGIYPHNVPVEVMCEEGIIVFMLYCFIHFRTIKTLKVSLKKLENQYQEKNALLVLGSFYLFELVLSLKQASLIGSVLVFSFAILIEAYSRVIEDQADNPREKPTDIPQSTVDTKRVLIRRFINQ
jgi:hypothetical protein